MQVKAKTSFYFQSEMWLRGVTKVVNAHNAHVLKTAGLVEEVVETETTVAKAPEKRETKPDRKKLEKK